MWVCKGCKEIVRGARNKIDQMGEMSKELEGLRRVNEELREINQNMMENMKEARLENLGGWSPRLDFQLCLVS